MTRELEDHERLTMHEAARVQEVVRILNSKPDAVLDYFRIGVHGIDANRAMLALSLECVLADKKREIATLHLVNGVASLIASVPSPAAEMRAALQAARDELHAIGTSAPEAFATDDAVAAADAALAKYPKPKGQTS